MRKIRITESRVVMLLKLEASDAYYPQSNDLIGAEMRIQEKTSKYIKIIITKSINNSKFANGTTLSFKYNAKFEPLD